MTSELWQVVGGEVRVAVDEAEWWGASLAVLLAAVHHPGTLADQLPETDPLEVASDVQAGVAELYAAARIAGAHARDTDAGEELATATASVRRDGAEIVFAPGAEVANLAWCLELFASAVLDPIGADAAVARGATAYAASAWSADIGKASGTLGGTGAPGEGRTGSGPSAVDGVQHRRAAPDHGTSR